MCKQPRLIAGLATTPPSPNLPQTDDSYLHPENLLNRKGSLPSRRAEVCESLQSTESRIDFPMISCTSSRSEKSTLGSVLGLAGGQSSGGKARRPLYLVGVDVCTYMQSIVRV